MSDVSSESSQILVYRSESGNTRVDVRLEGGTVWLNQNQIADLFQTSPQNIGQHIFNVYAEGELDEAATSRAIGIERQEGMRTVRREILFYNLDLIISVGYRVKSRVATQFRIWATERLVEYIVKGFTMDDERLKEGRTLGEDYFDELLERIRDIRASEKRFYQKLRDIFALSVDYDKAEATARTFFQTVQNKVLFAVTGSTAAEIIASRADHGKPNMGLTSWKGSRLRKGDVTTSKNYLDATEIDELNRIVVMYLDFAEDRAQRGIVMYMADWKERLDAFLKFNEREMLDNLGSVSMEVAKHTALTEYEAFDRNRREREAVQADEEDIEALADYIERLEEENHC